MPVVTIRYDRIQKILGRKISREKILSTLPFLGLDIEEEAQGYVNVEYSPNRPDFSTDYGIATALQGILGIKSGVPKLKIRKGRDAVIVDSSVSKVRPFLTSIEARNGKLDDETIKQIIAMQEDLHNGIGRKRRKASIGIHDLDKIRFPLVYNTVSETYRFTPLGATDEMTISEILEKTDTGIEYAHLLHGKKRLPIIIDNSGSAISFPPIINSKLTEVTTETKNLLVEVTATDKNSAEDALAILAYALQSAGFELHSIKISGARNSTTRLGDQKMVLDPGLVNDILGVNFGLPLMIQSLRKSRLDAKRKGKKILCTIPRYRTDIFTPTDLVEEVALGYGIQNLNPTIPVSTSAGRKNLFTTLVEDVRATMIGLGYSQVMNFELVGKEIQYDMVKRDSSKLVSVADSKSQEHTILRESLLPGLMDVLSRNIHESYPQKIFEIGTVFSRNEPIAEEIHLGCLSAHNDVGFTEIKSVIQSLLQTALNLRFITLPHEDPMFVSGRTARILADNKDLGLLGEVSTTITDNFKLRIPVAGFEIKISPRDSTNAT